ncbi:MAG: DNA alkylation repair protein [Bacteroidales bacterium]|nr:DNA alkylation repair protein [Bacteroidales bacterium]
MENISDIMFGLRNPERAVKTLRFFKMHKADEFLGITMPVTREVVKAHWKATSFEELESCIASRYHEVRMAALLMLVQHYKHASHVDMKEQCVDFYLAHTAHIDNWDLVDVSCYEILGDWLLDKPRGLLYDLAHKGKTIWEQRIGMVSTMALVRAGECDDTYNIADVFLEKPTPLHDLLQKAAGWLLREAGKCDGNRLRTWLEVRRTTMPRTMLRYAIEKFSDEERKHFLGR